jgi:hypothetical protein
MSISVDKENYEGKNKILIDCLKEKTTVRLVESKYIVIEGRNEVNICYLSNPNNSKDLPACKF